jgi:hypothetical protein
VYEDSGMTDMDFRMGVYGDTRVMETDRAMVNI